MKKKEVFIVGTLELCDLPDLSVFGIDVRVDTGAKTSSLHVDHIETFTKKGRLWVRFDIYPETLRQDKFVTREAPVQDIRTVKSSTAHRQERYMINTVVVLGKHSWEIELTLSDRSDMTYLMLLGREAMKNKVLVDPSRAYLVEYCGGSASGSEDKE